MDDNWSNLFGGDWNDQAQASQNEHDNLINQILGDGAHGEMSRWQLLDDLNQPETADLGAGFTPPSPSTLPYPRRPNGFGEPAPSDFVPLASQGAVADGAPDVGQAGGYPGSSVNLGGWAPGQGDAGVASANPPFPGLAPDTTGGGWYDPFPADGPYAIGQKPDLNKGEGIQPFSGAHGNAQTSTLPQQALGNAAQNALSIDQSFLDESEGKNLQPYFPKGGNAKVGITAGTGVDLGTHTVDDLKRWGVSPQGVQDLTPALGLKGRAAQDYLNANPGKPLQLSDADMQAINQGALGDIASKVQQNFDAAGSTTKFADLPMEVRTAILDLAYQYGPNLAGAAPKFWDAITSGDWGGAIGELRDFGDRYRTRRGREADEMQRGVLN